MPYLMLILNIFIICFNYFDKSKPAVEARTFEIWNFFNCLLFRLNLLILSPNLIWICQRLFGCVVKTWIQNAKQCGKILFSIAFLLFKYVALFSFETDLAGIWLSLFSFTGTLFVNREHSSHTFLYIYLLYQINQFSKLI